MNFSLSERFRILDAAFIKRLAIISMLIDHSAASLLYYGVIQPNRPITEGSPLWNVVLLYRFLRGVGRFAFPVFCFFLIEGFLYTRSKAKYVMRLFLFGILSELPFDLALFRRIRYDGHQNVMFELAFGIAMLWVFELIGELKLRSPELRLALQYLSTIPFIVIAGKLSLDYGNKGMMLILLLYVLHNERYLQCVAGAIFISLWEWPAVFAFIPLLMYNGKRGKQNKYFFYAFYPGHLFLLFLISHFVLGISLLS
ncbi:MAG: TraX family protein [Lachnospiraceae bacterium]|nr:TraX family protein [Lachnospiraceae bacterium]